MAGFIAPVGCGKRLQNGSDGVTCRLSRRDLGLLLFSGAVIVPKWATGEVRIADEVVGDEVETSSGLRYYDFRAGKGRAVESGSTVTVHFTCGTTGARYGWKIFSTYEQDEPLRFVVDSKSVIPGLNEAVASMREGGRRRAIIPAKLGYRSGKDKPMPPGFEERQRFKNLFLNSNRPYVPDLVFDIELLRVK